MNKVILSKRALKDLKYWKKQNNKVVLRKIRDLIEEIKLDHSKGTGQPEYLKNLKFWSRRITGEHRLTYDLVEEKTILIFGMRGHY